jgi:hypothetical protein
MVSSKRVRVSLDVNDAVSWCVWPVAKEYYLYSNGEIKPDYGAGWKRTMDKPLFYSNLFKSFADLGARGDALPGAAILRWVRRHGLLRFIDPDGYGLALDNQAPITVDEFKEEARLAYEALTLYGAIHRKDHNAIRVRLRRERWDPPGRPGEGTSADVYLDGRPIPATIHADGELSDDEALGLAKVGLESLVQDRIKGVEWRLDRFSGHPRPQEVYRTRLVPRVPDLHRAIWFQLALLMEGTRPVKFCEICEGPMFRPRRDQMTCSAQCRKAKSRRKESA